MKVCQNAHLLFLCTKPRLSQAGALLLPKDFVSLSITFYTRSKKIHFRPYNPNQTVLFPQELTRILQSMIQFGWLTLWLRA